MARFSDDYTARIRVQYTIDGSKKSGTVRFDDGGDILTTAPLALSTWTAAVKALLDALEPVDSRSALVWTAAEYAPRGGDIFTPLDTSSLTGTTGAGDPTPANKASLLSVTGRTTAGGRWVLYISGSRVTYGETAISSDWRLTTAENAAFDTWHADYAAPGGANTLVGNLVGNDNEDLMLIRPYVNVSYSRRLINAARA